MQLQTSKQREELIYGYKHMATHYNNVKIGWWSRKYSVLSAAIKLHYMGNVNVYPRGNTERRWQVGRYLYYLSNPCILVFTVAMCVYMLSWWFLYRVASRKHYDLYHILQKLTTEDAHSKNYQLSAAQNNLWKNVHNYSEPQWLQMQSIFNFWINLITNRKLTSFGNGVIRLLSDHTYH